MKFIKAGDEDRTQDSERSGAQVPASSELNAFARSAEELLRLIGERFHPATEGKPTQKCIAGKVSDLPEKRIQVIKLYWSRMNGKQREDACGPKPGVIAGEQSRALQQDDDEPNDRWNPSANDFSFGRCQRVTPRDNSALRG